MQIRHRIDSKSFQIRKAFDRLGEALDSLVRVAMLDPVAHTVLNVTFKYNLPHPVQRRLRGVYLSEHVLAGDVLVNHTVNSLHLSDYLFQPGAGFPNPYIASSRILRNHKNSQ